MNEKIIVGVDTEEAITALFYQYCVDHNLWSSKPIDIDELKRNISIFSGAIENYLIDHYGLDLEDMKYALSVINAEGLEGGKE